MFLIFVKTYKDIKISNQEAQYLKIHEIYKILLLKKNSYFNDIRYINNNCNF